MILYKAITLLFRAANVKNHLFHPCFEIQINTLASYNLCACFIHHGVIILK